MQEGDFSTDSVTKSYLRLLSTEKNKVRQGTTFAQLDSDLILKDAPAVYEDDKDAMGIDFCRLYTVPDLKNLLHNEGPSMEAMCHALLQ
jgi:hypothetical protein